MTKKKTRRGVTTTIKSRVNMMRWTPEGEAINQLELARDEMLFRFTKRIDKLADKQAERIRTEIENAKVQMPCIMPNCYRDVVDGGDLCSKHAAFEEPDEEDTGRRLITVKDDAGFLRSQEVDENNRVVNDSGPLWPVCVFAGCHERAEEGGFTCKQHTRWSTDDGVEYDKHPNHPLCGIPKVILTAARNAMTMAADENDVARDMVEPIADMVVMNLLPWIDKDKARLHIVDTPNGSRYFHPDGHEITKAEFEAAYDESEARNAYPTSTPADETVLISAGCSCEAKGIGKPRYDINCPIHGVTVPSTMTGRTCFYCGNPTYIGDERQIDDGHVAHEDCS